MVVSLGGICCNIRKFVGKQLRSTSYRVKQVAYYKVNQDQALYYQPTYTDPVDEESPCVIESEPPRVALPVVT